MKEFFKAFGFWLGTLLLWELLLHFSAFTGIVRFLPGIGFTICYAAVLTVLLALPGWAGRICGWILPPLLALIYAVQLVYYEVFGSFLSLAFVSAGGDAVTQFYTIVFGAIWRRLPQLLLMILPLMGYYVLRHLHLLYREAVCWQCLLGAAAAAGVLFGGTVLTLPLYGQDANQPAAMLRNPATTIDRWAESFGFLTAEALDLARQGSTAAPSLEVEAPVQTAQINYKKWNLLPGLDFEALEAQTEDPAIATLNSYFAAQTGTEKNDYTGMFEGYNLIVVCAEAFSNYVIDETLTPTLYRMSTEGIVFENFYNSFPNLTTNGEYSLCMGLMPDLSRMSFAVSVDHYLPYALGNICTEHGMTAMAYHNNVGTFYNRINTHTNMGYTFKAVDFGLDMEAGSPSSDLEMMEKSIPDYLEQEPFHAYYMTYSGHADYDFTTNAMSIKNKEKVEQLPYSEQVQAYIACQLELEVAMQYLIETLEEAGIADRTLVVLTGDHLPYGLSADAYAELAGDAVAQDPFWKYRNSFLCWTGALKEPVMVEDYCCTMDILPTILNLMGWEYDSRLLTGRDVLADTTHMALLKDGSFLMEEMNYDANTGEITWKQEEDDDLAQKMLQYASNQFAVSAAILSTDYYDFVYSTLDLSVERTERERFDSYADTDGTWYEDAVELLTTYGALSGGSTGAFNGERPASRADFVAMVTRSMGLAGSSGANPFTDVEREDWYYDTLAAAAEAGLIAAAENFRPTDLITVEEVTIVLNRAKNGAWVATAVDEAVRKQAETGYAGAAGTVSRGAAAYLVAKMVAPDEIASPELAPVEEPQPELAPVHPQPQLQPMPEPEPEPEPIPELEVEEEPFIPAPDPLAPISED